MKKWIALLLAALMLLGTLALAEKPDYSAMTTEELEALREKNAQELLEVSAVLGARAHAEALEPVEGSLGKIRELFPDEILACYVRDQLTKFSIEQSVTQAELDQITRIYFWATNEYPKDLTGIGYLRNLRQCTVANFYCHFMPDDMRNCTQLELIYFLNSSVEAIPEWIGELTMLRTIEINRGTIRVIPESIGNLTRLERLTLENNDIEVIPATIANCVSLKSLELENNNISEIPEEMWAMEFETLVLSGNPIR